MVRRLPAGERRAGRAAARGGALGRRRSARHTTAGRRHARPAARGSVSVPELAIAGFCGAVGVRSLIGTLRRQFEPEGVRDRLLYALYVTCRAGWWLTLGFFF